MTDPEGLPPSEPWRDETTDHIDELSRLLRRDDDAGSVPSYVPQTWNTVPPSEAGRLHETRPVPELEKYLGESGTSPHRVAVLSDIPRLIGGLKSLHFIVDDGRDRSDAPPEEGLTVDLRHTMIEAESIGDFTDFFHRAERQADAQYADALFASQQVVADARERGVNIDVLLVPETVNMSATDYFDRLQRLSQDLGISVVINTEDHEEGCDQWEEFRCFNPPAASSSEAYWEERARQALKPERTRINDPPSNEDLEAAIDQFWDTCGEDETAFQQVLWTLAFAAPETLEEELNSNHRYVIEQLAHFSGDDYKRHYLIVCARVIMAKLGNLSVFERLMHEARDHYWQTETDKIVVPLGIYARRDSGIRNLLITSAEVAAQNHADTTVGAPLTPWLGALYHSFSPGVGPYLANYLRAEQPEGHNVQQIHSSRTAAIEWMPKYVDAVNSLPESDERTAALDAIKEAALSTLDQEIDPRETGDLLARLRRTAGDILLRVDIADQEEPLHRHMLWLYEHRGSLITDRYFEEQYLQYRNLYGDIPEISQRITIR